MIPNALNQALAVLVIVNPDAIVAPRGGNEDPKDRQYVLITDTSTTAEDYDSPKSNVPIESGLVIPARNGWAAYRAAYTRAVDIRRGMTEEGAA